MDQQRVNSAVEKADEWPKQDKRGLIKKAKTAKKKTLPTGK